MGYLTTFTVYNDGCDQIKNNPKEFAEKVYKACLGVYHRTSTDGGYFGVGNHCNLVSVQKPRHADDHTVYVHMGNTVIEMNEWSEQTRKLMEKNPDFFNDLLHELETTTKALKKMQKNTKK